MMPERKTELRRGTANNAVISIGQAPVRLFQSIIDVSDCIAD